MLPAGRGGRGGEGEEVRGGFVCVVTHKGFTCSTTGWLLVKRGVNSQGKLSWSKRHLC